jgi:predicted RNA binding protein YcfA (HicA-like mRNA interferase family)
VNAADVIRVLKSLGCKKVRQNGSHIRFVSPCGKCHTTVPDHGNKTLGRGLLAGIERDMASCLGTKWLLGK